MVMKTVEELIAERKEQALIDWKENSQLDWATICSHIDCTEEELKATIMSCVVLEQINEQLEHIRSYDLQL